MNPFLIMTFFSFKKEFFYVLLAFLLVILMPLIGVIILTRTGLDFVSERLVAINEVTNEVQILNPFDGSVYKTIKGPFVWPVTGIITLEFGESSRWQLFHTGIDIANPEGKKGDLITPFMPGTVVYAGQISWGFGKHIIIDHGDNLASIYAHLETIWVEVGQEVKPGDVIGTEDSTGWATGPHLHFQINVFGIPVNPRVFLGGS
ncbi:MAG TPA: M23 family metallopeptidase [Patescibacteria group bacterium]|nr:M23 family metallopeptidase [Patescibacteria group bacterium]